MIKRSYFLLIFLIESSFSDKNYCDLKISEKNCCYITNTTINVENKEINWNLLDKKSGQLEITFPLKDYVKIYTLQLFVTETKDSSQCNESFITPWEVTLTENYSKYLHTSLDYKIKEEDDCAVCESELRVSFDHVFTGCYFLNISMFPKRESHLTSYFQFIDTNYQEITPGDIYNSNPILYDGETSELSVVFTLPFPFSNKRTIVEIEANCTKDNVCPKFGNGSLANYAYMPKNHTLKKKYELDVCRINRTDVDGFESIIDDPICLYNNYSNDGNGTIECFYKLPPGHYDFEVSLLNDIRCPMYHSLWGDGQSCRWKLNINVKEKEPSNTFISYFDFKDNLLTTLQYSLIMGSIILLILIIVVVILIKCNRNNYTTTRSTFNDSEDNDDDIESRSKIFLLYARECHQFMDTMEAFRTVLRYEGHFEIFDIYDNCLYNTIVLNPEAWIQDKLATCKVVLILTECATKLHENCQNTKSKYKLPQPFDNNFLYALRNINQSVAINNYKNLYIVQFSFDHSDYKTFSFLTPYTRYYLPNNFTKLFNDLKDENVNSIEITSDQSFESAVAYTLFLKKYKIYEDYVKKRPYYLEEIVNLQPDE